MLRPALLTLSLSLFTFTGVAHADSGSVKGGGRRGDFSFAGHVAVALDGSAKGDFMIVVHPSIPSGGVFSVVCRYNRFYNGSRSGRLVQFDAYGVCTTVGEDGGLPSWTAHNHFTIVDNGPGTNDTIDVNFYGPVGVAVPGGTLSHGNFVVGL